MNELLMEVMMQSPSAITCDGTSLVYDEDTGLWVVIDGNKQSFEDFNEALEDYAVRIGILMLVVSMPPMVGA